MYACSFLKDTSDLLRWGVVRESIIDRLQEKEFQSYTKRNVQDVGNNSIVY